MKSDADMMILAVVADPLDVAAQAALTDALQEQNGDDEFAKRQVAHIVLESRIDAFVAHAQGLINREFAQRFKNLTPPTLKTQYLSDDWCRIVKVEYGKVASVYGFVRLTDGANKTMGAMAAGGVYKPASFKKPAKHARGSVFSADFDNCCGPWGINYLK